MSSACIFCLLSRGLFYRWGRPRIGRRIVCVSLSLYFCPSSWFPSRLKQHVLVIPLPFYAHVHTQRHMDSAHLTCTHFRKFKE